MTAAERRRIRVAVIGLGFIGRRHAQTVFEEPLALLVAVVDPIPRPTELLSDLQVSQYTNVKDLLASADKPDCAIISTPNDTHVSVGLELIKAGVHLLVEKPISTDIESGRQLIEAAAKANVKLLVGHHRRFNPYIIAAKRSLDSGAIGTVTAVSGLWLTYKPADYFQAPTEWRQGSSGGVLLNNMIHEIDLLHHLFGPVVRVYAEKTATRRGYVAEEGAAITLKFANGMVGTFLICDNTPSPHNFESGTGENPLIPKTGRDFLRAFGSEGVLELPTLALWSHGNEEKSWFSNMTQTSVDVEQGTPFVLQLKHFLKVIENEEEPLCTGAAGLQALVVCEALKMSVKEEKPITIDEFAGFLP